MRMYSNLSMTHWRANRFLRFFNSTVSNDSNLSTTKPDTVSQF